MPSNTTVLEPITTLINDTVLLKTLSDATEPVAPVGHGFFVPKLSRKMGQVANDGCKPSPKSLRDLAGIADSISAASKKLSASVALPEPS